MARNDGIHRTVARNNNLSASQIANAQRHNEREKESYTNPDIVPERLPYNVHYKSPPLEVSVVLPQNDRVQLTAVSDHTGSAVYQWQILAGGTTWVNIAGADGVTLDLSYAMVASLLVNDTAQIRCTAAGDDADAVSSEVTVTVDYDVVPEFTTEEISREDLVISGAEVVGEPVITPPAAEPAAEPAAQELPGAVDEVTDADAGIALASAEVRSVAAFSLEPASLEEPAGDEPAAYDPNAGIATAAEEPVTPATYSIVINYVFADGKQAANPWTGSFAAGSDITQTIKSPVVLGYTADQAEVTVNVTSIAENKTYTVTYAAAEVTYTVEHYQQNITDDNYTLVSTDTKTGYTESEVGDSLANTYTGFYALLYDASTKIAADGSTTIEIRYDRYYYLMSFDLTGGYGVEPIYARYGTPVTIGTPTRSGYTFTGWSPEFSYTTMPALNTKFTATWQAGNTTYDVVFWYENANDDGYSQAGVLNDISASAGATVNGSAYKDTNFTGKDVTHFTYSHADENVVVSGNGSTVVNVYYTRNVYTLTFIAPGKCILDEHTHTDCTIICGLDKHQHDHDTCCTRYRYHYGECNTEKCPNDGYEHEHSSSCYSCGKTSHSHNSNCTNENRENTVKIITAKYQANIQDSWPIKNNIGFDGTGYWWDDVDEVVFSAYTLSLDTMPGANIVFEGSYQGDDAKIHYYVENLEGDTTGRQYNGKYYTLYKTVTMERSGYLTEDEEFHPISGYTKGGYTPNGIFESSYGGTNLAADNYLYYTRNSYTLSFSNNGSVVRRYR